MNAVNALSIALAALAAAQDWPNYGNDPGGTRHSPLTAIHPANVTKLKPVWTYHHGDISDPKKNKRSSAFEGTPLMMDGTLYFPTPFNRVIALDAATGREKWTFDPKIDKSPGGDGFVCRGLASWKDSKSGERRIFLATLDSRLIALDAASGKQLFQVGLLDGIEQGYPGEYHVSSPPTVVGDRVIVGSAIDDNSRARMESGAVRAFDARNGKLAWSWDPIPNEKQSGAANAWTVFAADPARDLVFIPTGSASPDHYGGLRPGENKWANSVVAIRASTGAFVWGFQTTHHDLWDYDIPAQPVLIEFKGKAALVQPTKTGLLFVLDRETGAPLIPVEERRVPSSDIAGEQTSPTQPFPVAPPPLVPHKIVRKEDAWGLAYFDRKSCEGKIAALRSEGVYTPPSFQGTIQFPGIAGGSNWGSVAYDPARKLIIANTSRLPFWVKLAPRDKIDEVRKQLTGDVEFNHMKGTPFGMFRGPLLSPMGIPCLAPPWGALAAVDLEAGAIRWEVPLGTIRDIAPVPLPMAWGTPNLGGPLVTAGGVVFIGAAMDNYLRAFDTQTGKELWKSRLPAGAQATPMSYEVNGRQFVVIAAGGHGKMGTKLGDSLIAYALVE